MTASKPEVVAYLNFGALTGEPIACNDCWSELASEPLIRLTDHERLQAEAERLQADHEAARAADKARIAELEAERKEVREILKAMFPKHVCEDMAKMAQQGKEGET